MLTGGIMGAVGTEVNELMADCIEVDRRLISGFDLELPIIAGRKSIGGGQLGVDAGEQ
jgi:hypothetical protein